LNSEKIWKIWQKPKLDSEKIWKIQKKIVKWQFSSIFSISFHISTYFSSLLSLSFHNFLLYFPNLITIKLNSEKIWTLWKKSKLKSEKIWKIQKKIVKKLGKYRGKVTWIVKRYEKYGFFDIFHIISQFLQYFPYHFTFQLLYFPYLFTIFFCTFPIFSLFSSLFSKSFHYSTSLSSIFCIKYWRNCEMIWKISKKGKLNSEKIWKSWKKSKLNSEKIGFTKLLALSNFPFIYIILFQVYFLKLFALCYSSFM
jgi:hypothetical protein